jgi:hypothetical protein
MESIRTPVRSNSIAKLLYRSVTTPEPPSFILRIYSANSTKDFFPPVTLLPQRALCYIKATFPPSTFEQTWQALMHSLWIPPHTNITIPSSLASTLSNTNLFTEKEVEEIMEATVDKEWKDKLLGMPYHYIKLLISFLKAPKLKLFPCPVRPSICRLLRQLPSFGAPLDFKGSTILINWAENTKKVLDQG